MRRQSSWVRYGLARLRPLSRPVFWAPSIALLLLILFAWEFFSRPELGTYFGISTPDETLSREDQAIGADIDSLSLLMNDIKIAPKPLTTENATPTAPTPAPTNSTTPNRLFSSPATEAVTPPQSAQIQSGQGVFGVFRNALTLELGLTTAQRQTTDPTTPAPLPANRLQEAISKLSASENRSMISQTPIEGTIRLESSGTSINAAPLPNSFSTLIEGTQRIAPGTMPTVSAPLPIATPLNAPVLPATAQPTETQSSDFGVIQNVRTINQPVNQQPFSVPRSIPGRTIGGGNINTFSNP